MLSSILLYAGLFVAGLVAGLKVIAPLTATAIDDKILIYAEDAEKVLEGLGGHGSEAQGVTVVKAAV